MHVWGTSERRQLLGPLIVVVIWPLTFDIHRTSELAILSRLPRKSENSRLRSQYPIGPTRKRLSGHVSAPGSVPMRNHSL
jgi:hypothetical protein